MCFVFLWLGCVTSVLRRMKKVVQDREQSGFDDRLETAVEHPLAIERHVLRIAHARDARVFDDAEMPPAVRLYLFDLGHREELMLAQFEESVAFPGDALASLLTNASSLSTRLPKASMHAFFSFSSSSSF